MIQEIYEWCVGKAMRKLPAQAKKYDEGYRAGYQDCARFLMEWIEEEGVVEEVAHD